MLKYFEELNFNRQVQVTQVAELKCTLIFISCQLTQSGLNLAWKRINNQLRVLHNWEDVKGQKVFKTPLVLYNLIAHFSTKSGLKQVTVLPFLSSYSMWLLRHVSGLKTLKVSSNIRSKTKTGSNLRIASGNYSIAKPFFWVSLLFLTGATRVITTFKKLLRERPINMRSST